MQSQHKTHAQHIRQKHCYAFKHMLSYFKYISDLPDIRQYLENNCICGHFQINSQNYTQKILVITEKRHSMKWLDSKF